MGAGQDDVQAGASSTATGCSGRWWRMGLSLRALRISNRFSRSALVTTQTLLRLMAAAANMGFSVRPSGTNTPAASGMPMLL